MQDEFFLMMRNLPEDVSDDIIEEMLRFADKDGDGQLSYEEFSLMITPPEPARDAKPHAAKLGLSLQTLSPAAGPKSIHASPILPTKNSEVKRNSQQSSLNTSIPYCPTKNQIHSPA